jgi:hypothetical protein
MDDDSRTMKWRFPLTFTALTLAAAALTAALVGHINLIELPASFVARIEQDEIDDIVSALLLVGVAFLCDQILFTRRMTSIASLESERLRVVQVTMRTVQDIVNNGLNQLQLLRFDAEGHVPPESLALFDDAIRETVKSLTALGDLQAYGEKQLVVGTGLDTPRLS